MENIYKAYTREIDGKVFYFIKKFTTFPEYSEVPTILDSIGMHTDFHKACDIAKLYDESVISKLMNELHIVPESARIIKMHGVKAMTHTFVRNTHQAILKLKLAGF